VLSTTSTSANDRGVIHQLLVDLGLGSDRAHTVQVYAVGPLRILLVLVLAFVLSRLVSRLSVRLVGSLRLVSPLVRTTPRGQDRARTLAGVFASVFRLVIWVIAVLTILAQLSIDLTPFVATATVVGAAVGFGAQSLVKDFLSGVLILAEDQYGVGDSIVVGQGATATSGTVEGVNLRTTRIRSLDGMIWYVPNGEIRVVGNNTEDDSQALVDVVVPLGTDLRAAGVAAEGAGRDLAAESGWREVIVGEPVFAGVQTSDHDGVTLRVTAWTRPGAHFRVAREMRLRVLERLRGDGLAWTPEPGPPTGPGEPPGPGDLGGGGPGGGPAGGGRGPGPADGGADPSAGSEPGARREPDAEEAGTGAGTAAAVAAGSAADAQRGWKCHGEWAAGPRIGAAAPAGPPRSESCAGRHRSRPTGNLIKPVDFKVGAR
jgi:small conductance mechanosensitive channel